MNTIIVDEIDKVRECNACMPNNFIFSKCKIIFKDKRFPDTKVKLNSQIIKSDIKWEKGDEYYITMEIDDGYDKHKVRVILYSEDGLTYWFCGGGLLESTYPENKWEKALDRCEFTMERVVSTCNYIMATNRDRVQRTKPNTHVSNKIDKKQSEDKYKNKKVFLLDEIVEYVKDQNLTYDDTNHTEHVITCPCWGVRGHYRHYKSGKTIFIKEFEKGKDRGKVKPKGKIYTV